MSASFSDDQLAAISRHFGDRFGGRGSGITSSGISMEGGVPYIGVTLTIEGPEPQLPAEFEGLAVRVTDRANAGLA